MPHSFQSHFDEYQFAINHLVPTVPVEIKRVAQKMHDDLLANPEVTENEIDAAMMRTGLAEYPHRRAFQEMTSSDKEMRRAEIVLDHVETRVAEKVKTYVDSGVTLGELVKSNLFETEFDAEERHQIEDALLDADIHIREEFGAEAVNDEKKYGALVKKWEKIRDEIAGKIDELESLKNKDEKWHDEILDKAHTFREGFLVTEPDVSREEVEKEIEYWKGTMGEEV